MQDQNEHPHVEEVQLEAFEPTEDGDSLHDRQARCGAVLVPFRRELFDFLVPMFIPGSEPHVRTFTIWFDQKAGWKCCLRDKTAQAIAFVTSPSIGELFYDLCRGLRKESLKWKHDRSQ